MRWKEIIDRQWHGILYSYSQIFFARSSWYGVLLLLASFVNPVIGISGLLAVLITNIMADIFTLNPRTIREGAYGFNSAMVGMGLGSLFEMNAVFFLMLFMMSALCLILAIGLHGFLSKYHLPFMGLPFLFSMWLIILAAKFFTHLLPLHIGSYPLLADYLFKVNQVNVVQLPQIAVIFCRSLGAVFFQSNFLVGAIIAVGLFLYSRISFTLACLGFLTAFSIYRIVGIDTNDLINLFVGSNFIFFAIAIGGFFIVPNIWSYLMVIAIVPLVTLIHYGSSEVLNVFHLPAFTFSFTITTLFFLYALKWRTDGKRIHAVELQHSSPEKNLYEFISSTDNRRFYKYYPVSLPFWGEWMVSQGHDGKITHLGDWSKAFDFIILDEEMKSYTFPGNKVEDFYCYNKPILSPGEAYVESIVDNIDDNEIADVNTKQNWGNSIILNHGNGLYSQISHIKKESFKVKVGDYVKRGEPIALCGSSGRSPEPHIHFQLQTVPVLGAKTFEYPIASYIVKESKKFDLKIFEVPKEGQTILNPEINPLLKAAFYFIPGKKLRWNWNGNIENWEVYTDAWNRINIWCPETKSLARVENDGVVFRFNHFEGNRKSFLYHFYLSCYKVFLGYYSELSLDEKYPILHKTNFIVQWFEDLTVPFVQIVKSKYNMVYAFADDIHYTSKIELMSSSETRMANLILQKNNYTISLNSNGFDKIEVNENNKKTIALCEAQ